MCVCVCVCVCRIRVSIIRKSIDLSYSRVDLSGVTVENIFKFLTFHTTIFYSSVSLLLWFTEYCEINWHPSPYFGLAWTEMYYRTDYITCYFVFSYLLTNVLTWNKHCYTSTHSGIRHFSDTLVCYLHFSDNSEISDSADITNSYTAQLGPVLCTVRS